MTALPPSGGATDLAKSLAERVGVEAELVDQLAIYVALAHEHHSRIDLSVAVSRLGLEENDVNLIKMEPDFLSLVGEFRKDQRTLYETVCRDAAVDGAFLLSEVINDPDINPQIRVKAVSVAIEQSGFDQRKAAEQAAGASRFIVNINLEDPTKDVTISAPIIEHEGGTGL